MLTNPTSMKGIFLTKKSAANSLPSFSCFPTKCLCWPSPYSGGNGIRNVWCCMLIDLQITNNFCEKYENGGRLKVKIHILVYGDNS
jgi:hypothetical protein